MIWPAFAFSIVIFYSEKITIHKRSYYLMIKINKKDQILHTINNLSKSIK